MLRLNELPDNIFVYVLYLSFVPPTASDNSTVANGFSFTANSSHTLLLLVAHKKTSTGSVTNAPVKNKCNEWWFYYLLIMFNVHLTQFSTEKRDDRKTASQTEKDSAVKNTKSSQSSKFFTVLLCWVEWRNVWKKKPQPSLSLIFYR